jgi:tRNA pseudouridine55 synthase
VSDPTAPGAAPGPEPISGLLVIDKPLVYSSMAVCRRVRGALVGGGAPRKIKVGHGGTLDPLATGVLVILVGKATRLCEKIMAGEKRYEAEIDLAHVSTTDDREGTVSPVDVAAAPARERIEGALGAFTGRIQQRPPAHSAIWVDGERAYRLARRADRAGQGPAGHPEMPARAVDIHEIRVLEYAFPRLLLDVRCGKGTYMRSLARDMGTALGTGGMLTNLRRTGVGRFSIADAVRLDTLPRTLRQTDLRPLPAISDL